MDFPAFFSAVRAQPFGGSLSQAAVDGLSALLSAFEKYGDGDRQKLAYILATAFHESDRFKTMEEYASGSAYENRQALGNTQPGDGQLFKGRGFVQITGRRNYADWSNRLKLDLIGNPDLAEQRPIAARICVEGMMLGTFTGRKLSNYVDGAKADFKEARRVVNGTDRAVLIAGYAERFDKALATASYGPVEDENTAPAAIVAETRIPVSLPTVSGGLPAVLGSVSKAVGAAKGAAKGTSIPGAIALIGAKSGLLPAWMLEPDTLLALTIVAGVVGASAWAFISTYKAPPNAA